MRVLITGGAGFIGGHLAEKLLNTGHEVVVLDSFDPYYDVRIKRENVSFVQGNPAYTLIEGDIRDKELVARIFSEDNIDLVVHQAARAGVRPSLTQAPLYFDVNVMGTLNILENMRTNGVKKMLFASSSSVYGNNEKVPFSETDNVDHPISPYAASKKAGELLCYNYHHLYNFDILCLRYFTVYGPRQRPEMAISFFVKNILEGKPIPVFGDGTSERDYTYIDDIVQGITKAMTRLRGYEIINLGESNTITLSRLIETIEHVVGKKAIIDRQSMQPGDVNRTFADVQKAKSLIGYEPTTHIEDGIRKYVDWYRARL